MKALGSYVNDALTALRETMDEGTKRNARENLDRYETLNQALIKERKRAERMEEALQTGAKLNPFRASINKLWLLTSRVARAAMGGNALGVIEGGRAAANEKAQTCIKRSAPFSIGNIA